MSELKAFDVGIGRYTEDGYPCVVAFDADQNPRLLNEKVYLKSEADKVISDLEESHKMEVEQLLMEIVKLKEIDSKNRSAYYKDLAMMAKDVEHHKFKRCLAMYRYCAIKALYVLDCEGNDVEWKWYSKWMHKWYKLAEKFKETHNEYRKNDRNHQ